MAAKGQPKSGGRKKGKPNKVTGELKDMILHALTAVGGEEYLERQAEAEPKSFMLLLGRVLPLQVNGKVEGSLTIDPFTPLMELIAGNGRPRPGSGS